MEDKLKLKLYNTLTRQIEDFQTITPNQVKIYTCGLTVYSHPQIGNWVSYIYSDVLTRTLKALGYDVERIQNITDVGHLVSDDDSGEDKMEKGARAEGLTAWDVAAKYIKIADEEAYTKLKLLRPNKLVRATDLIDQQIEFVRILEEKGFTYAIPDEGIYFDTSKLNDYGKLARLDVKGLEAGARVDISGKKSKTDFALWKLSPRNAKRDMEWDSPWGKGFPGWHLECSVIARENLGDQIDIHTGGIDHIPVHHTNEIAQTETVTGKKPFSKFWFHNNFMKVNGAKLSKSLGNSYTLVDIEQQGYSLNAFKVLVLSSHYQTEGNFSWEILEAAQNRFNNWREASALVHQGSDGEKDLKFKPEVLEALANNLDTPRALSLIDRFVDQINQSPLRARLKSRELIDTAKDLLGIDLGVDDISPTQKELIRRRAQARADKMWVDSDEIRDLLLADGIKLKDTEHGQVWSRA